jgi:pilus assembly protein CpaB
MTRGKTPLIIAVVLGLIAFLVSWSAIKKRERDVRAGWVPTPVVAAIVDIPEGTVVTMDMVAMRSIPEQFVTASVVKPDSASYVVGQKVLVPLQAGDPLLWSQFETTRASERLSTKVLPRARAFTIAATGTTSVGGWVRPNDHVDVLGTFKSPEGEEVSLTLLQNVVVLATGKITGTTNVNLLPEGERAYGNISVLVSPEEAEVLLLGQELGALALSLRNENDVSVQTDRKHTSAQTLFDGERLQKLYTERQKAIEIIRGNTSAPAERH